MNMEERNSMKKLGFRRFLNSFKFSFDGLAYAYTHEQSMVLHFGITILVVVSGIVLKITTIEWLFLLLFIGLIFATELINTSIEAAIDLISPKIHPLAKIAKDTASAAVFALSVIAFIGGMVIFLPKVIEMLF
ncbi:MAG: diacylglycerol kinase family protein [Bacilli bacterium]|nr:diacylglycerol kinase family protein [Bacilli bacterium]